MTKPTTANRTDSIDTAAPPADAITAAAPCENLSPNQLVVEHRHLVLTIARMHRQLTTFYAGPTELEEMISEGMLALVESAHRYDPSRGVGFVTFAWHRIRGAILNTAQKRRRQMNLVKTYKSEKAGGNVGKSTGAQYWSSGEQYMASAYDLGEQPREPDVVSAEHLHRSLESLPPRNRKLLQDHVVAGKSLSEVGRELGISRFAAFRGYHTAINKIRADLGVTHEAA